MESEDEKTTREMRQSTRRALLSQAIFIALDVSSRFARTIDLSTGGLSVTLPQALRIGQSCAITFDVPHDDFSQRALITGRVTSCVASEDGSHRIGIRFVQADPVSKQLIKEAVDKYLETSRKTEPQP